MLLSLDGTFLVQILNFIAFWALLNYLYIAPTRRTIEARQRHIASQHDEARGLRERTVALQAQADAILSDARRQADALLRAASADADAQTRSLERATERAVHVMVSEAHATVAREQAGVEAGQTPFIEELARQMTERALSWEKVA